MCVCLSLPLSCLLGRYGSRCLQRDLPLPIFSVLGLVQMKEARGGAPVNNRFSDLSGEHLDGWMNQSVRVAPRYVASMDRFHPAASDADSLMVSCSLQTRSQFLRSWRKKNCDATLHI